MKLPIQSVPIDRVDVWSPNRSNSSAGVNPSAHYEGFPQANCGGVSVVGASIDAVCNQPGIVDYRHVTHPHQYGPFGGPKQTKYGDCKACPAKIPPKGQNISSGQAWNAIVGN